MPTDPRPWDELERLVAIEDLDAIRDFFREAPAAETPRLLANLPEEVRVKLLAEIGAETAAAVVEHIPDAQAVEIIERLEPVDAAAILHELPSDARADLLSGIDPRGADAILSELEPAEARSALALSQYAADVAGGLMRTEYVSYRDSLSVRDVLNDFRDNVERYQDYDVQYAYVIDDSGRLVGVLRLRDLVLAAPARPVREIMISAPVAVNEEDSLDTLHNFFEERTFLGVPVVDANRRLLGIVRRVDVERALTERLESDFRKVQGIVGEEIRTMPLFLRSRRRLSWLSVNVVLNLVAASVIALFQDTLSAAIALAVFLPIVSDMSGCSGNQAAAVTIRELTLGLVQPLDLFHVWLKEISVGLINGVALGLLVAVVAVLWKGNPYLGLVVGTAMAVNTMIAVSIGGLIPLVLKRLGHDPALASGPILTTVTDLCGFFLILGMATLIIERLADM